MEGQFIKLSTIVKNNKLGYNNSSRNYTHNSFFGSGSSMWIFWLQQMWLPVQESILDVYLFFTHFEFEYSIFMD